MFRVNRREQQTEIDSDRADARKMADKWTLVRSKADTRHMAGVDKRKVGSLPNVAIASLASSSLSPEHRLSGGDVEPETGDHPRTGRLVPAEAAQPAGCPGLVNIRLSCYLNAALQSLAPCQEFVTWLGQYWGNSSCGLTTATINVLYGLIDPKNDRVDPRELQVAFYGRNQQQNCHKMFQYLMQSIEEEISVCDAADKANPFLGKQKVRKRCESCLHEYPTTISSFRTITLDTTPGRQCALVDLLTRCTEREIMPNVDCTKCALAQPSSMPSKAERHRASKSPPPYQFYKSNKSTKRRGVAMTLEARRLKLSCTEEQHANAGSTAGHSVYLKQISWEKLPKCLCIHINKTSTTGRVLFEDTLMLRSQTQAVCYCLVAVVVLLSGVNSGQYVTYRLGPLGHQWYKTSHASMTRVSLCKVLATTPYMLLYGGHMETSL